jgi:hypothetical protein
LSEIFSLLFRRERGDDFLETRLGKIECSLRQRWHLELDLGELIGSFADLAKEGQARFIQTDDPKSDLNASLGAVGWPEFARSGSTIYVQIWAKPISHDCSNRGIVREESQPTGLLRLFFCE